MIGKLHYFAICAAVLCLASLCGCVHQPPAPSCPPAETKVLNLPQPGHFRREMEACLALAETSGQDCSELLTKRTIF